MSELNVKKTISFAETLLDTKYTWWIDGDTTSDNHYPFYITKVKDNCAGFINLLRLNLGLDIKGSGDYKGGTYCWHNYFKENNMLEEFDIHKTYPIGSLLIREYSDPEDQGHVAVLYKKSKGKNEESIYYCDIIHAYSEGEYPDSTGKVGTTNTSVSHFSISTGYYNYIVLPKDWLT